MDRIDFLRDIKKLVIVAMFSDDEFMERLVLKGGNLLDIVYQLSARASVDVDLSMSGEFEDVAKLKIKVVKALESTFCGHGYIVFDFKLTEEPPKLSDNMKDFWGGYRVRFKLIDVKKHDLHSDNIEDLRRNAAVIGEKGSTVFQVDISKHEFCEDKLRFEVDEHAVYGYSPEMFVAEKLRAICQQMDEYVQLVRLHPRPRPKDFVDIQIIAQHYGISFKRDDFRELLRHIFAVKKVPVGSLGEIRTTKDYHEQGFQAVRDTVYPDFNLESFDFYFDYVVRSCELLKPLWDE
jgi:predicted nucleotidyltransferase component of viral defense system